MTPPTGTSRITNGKAALWVALKVVAQARDKRLAGRPSVCQSVRIRPLPNLNPNTPKGVSDAQADL